MGLKDISNIFGRYLIVGFYIPVFFWLAYLKLTAGNGLLPDQVEPESAASFAVIGVAALVFAFILQGARRPLERVLCGYPIMHLWVGSGSSRLLLGANRIRALTCRKTLACYDDLAGRATPRGPKKPGETDVEYGERRLAEYHLKRRFPNRREKVMPTKYGNRVRAWEDYAREAWSLETVVIEPHIESLLTPQELGQRQDAETDACFAVNGFYLGILIGFILGIDRALEPPSSLWFIALCLLPFALAWILYEISVVAAETWGNSVRASIDLHRLELYEKLSTKEPLNQADDRFVGLAINRMLMYGEPIPDEWRSSSAGGC